MRAVAKTAPGWARARLESTPWVTVRRAYVAGAVAIGIRGHNREERFAAVVPVGAVEEMIVPEMLAERAPPRKHDAFEALESVNRAARAHGLCVGPIGAAGFELGTGVPALHERSDLDVLVRSAPAPRTLRGFARDVAGLAIRVDAEIAFGDGYGAALDEVLRGGSMLVKTPGGPRMLPPFSVSQAAVQALIAEAELTPKPALVDRRGTGAHADLSLDLLVRSAIGLHETFEELAAAARGSAIDANLRACLAAIGREGERRMLAATGGVNTHRGAIWTLGLLIAAQAACQTNNAASITTAAGTIASFSDSGSLFRASNGSSACRRFGVRGAVGEAQDGFPHARKALAVLRAGRARGSPEATARLDALLAVMTTLDDTCLLHRGGLDALRAAQAGAAVVLAAGGVGADRGADAYGALEMELLARNASPGGAADCLGAALFLDTIERRTWV
jgi:triphosphoribosyl-dephospho-CoA synthase